MKRSTTTSTCVILGIMMSLGGAGRAAGDCALLAGSHRGVYSEVGVGQIGTIRAEVQDFQNGAIEATVTFVEFDVTFTIVARDEAGRPFGCRVDFFLPSNEVPTSDGDFLRIHSVHTAGSTGGSALPSIGGGWITTSGRSGTWGFDIGGAPQPPPPPPPPPSPPPPPEGDCTNEPTEFIWFGQNGDSFSNADRWDLLEAPGPEDRALFSDNRMNGGALAFDRSVTNDSVDVREDRVTFLLNSFTYSLTESSGCFESLAVRGGESEGEFGGHLELSTLESPGPQAGTVDARSISVADSPFDQGSLAVHRVTLRSSGDCTVGFEGKGILAIERALFSGNNLIVGDKPGSIGEVIVEDPGEEGAGFLINVDLSGRTLIGVGGVGTMSVRDRGSVSSGQRDLPSDDNLSIIGVEEGSRGTVTVQGTWQTHDLEIARDGFGDLFIDPGGAVQSRNVVMGLGSSGKAAATVRSGGNWEIFGGLFAGIFGDSSVTVEAEGSVSAELLNVGPKGRVDASRITVAASSENPTEKRLARAQVIPPVETGIIAQRLVLEEGGEVNADEILLEAGGELGGSGAADLNIINRGIIDPGGEEGQTAEFTINGDLAQTADGEVRIDIGGRTPGREHDVLTINGRCQLGGRLKVHLVNGFVPNVGDRFEVLRFVSREGEYDAIDSDGTGVIFSPEFDDGRMTLVARVVGEPGRVSRGQLSACGAGCGPVGLMPLTLALLGICGLRASASVRQAERAR